MSTDVDLLQQALRERYTIERELGSGGMATVYEALDLKHDRQVAIKVLKREVAAALGSDRFLREVTITARLSHPHILPLLDSGEAAGFLYYVMPCVEGGSLRERLTRDKQMPLDTAIEVTQALGAALHAAHESGVVHRDIKPENILFQSGLPMIADFGIAKALAAVGAGQLTETGLAVGTPIYMSPEQASGSTDVDRRSDVYALGCVLYEMLGGQPPFVGPTPESVLRQHLIADVPSLNALRPSLPDSVTSGIRKALAKSPADRFRTTIDFAEAIATAPAPSPQRSNRNKTIRRTVVGLTTVVVLGALWSLVQSRVGPNDSAVLSETEALNVALPRIVQLVDDGDFVEAYQLAVQAERVIPQNGILQDVWPQISRFTSIRTDPPGAMVEVRSYGDREASWDSLGVTPLDAARIPIDLLRWRLTLPGYAPVEMVSSGLQFPRIEADDGLQLTPVDEHRSGMVLVPGADADLGIPGLFDREAVSLPSYWLDRYEVTNRAYKEFVDDGGYGNPSYWTEPFLREGREATFADAIGEFVDRTGRPGPSTWLGGDYPDGQGSYPVVGISWFEAAAYANYVGKELPTIYHWHYAAGADLASHVIPVSNFGSGTLAPVGEFEGVSPFGIYDMAGNAKEWVYNASGERRYLLGGAWDEPSYLFREAETRLPWDRSGNNGMRLMQSSQPVPDVALVELTSSEVPASSRPVSAEVWSAYASLYEYDRTDLDPRIERTDTSEDAIVQRASYRAAYGSERISALLFLPTAGQPPYQPLVVFPGSSALAGGQVAESSSLSIVEFFLKGGRAVLLPVYQGTYERATGLADDNPDTTATYRDHVIMWSKDLGRSIDYLESRDDIDDTRIGYYGLSWGAGMGPLLGAVEPRIATMVLNAGGFWNTRTRPEVDQRNFAPRVQVPVLMLNGRNDPFFPFADSQLPMYHALGTPGGQKRHVVYQSGHSVPRLDSVREILDWLDEHLGPVR